jgi:hypothetical protein
MTNNLVVAVPEKYCVDSEAMTRACALDENIHAILDLVVQHHPLKPTCPPDSALLANEAAAAPSTPTSFMFLYDERSKAAADPSAPTPLMFLHEKRRSRVVSADEGLGTGGDKYAMYVQRGPVAGAQVVQRSHIPENASSNADNHVPTNRCDNCLHDLCVFGVLSGTHLNGKSVARVWALSIFCSTW